jgi:hypothetical protein
MVAPPKWSEPIKHLNLKYTYIRGKKQFIIEDETIILEGQSIKIEKTRVQYSNPLIKNVNTLIYLTLLVHHQEDK